MKFAKLLLTALFPNRFGMAAIERQARDLSAAIIEQGRAERAIRAAATDTIARCNKNLARLDAIAGKETPASRPVI